MSSPKQEDMYWVTCQTARSRIYFLHILHGTATMTFFGPCNVTMATYILIGISCLYFLVQPHLSLRHEAANNFLFDTSICTITVVAAFNFSTIAWRDLPPGFEIETLPLQAQGFINRMSRGEIPFPAVGTMLAPILMTSAGLPVRIAKVASFAHAFIFVSTAVAIFMKTNSESCNLNGNSRNLCRANFFHDLSSMALTLSVAFMSCLPSAETTIGFVKILRDSQQADSVLNHVLKNSIAGAASLVEIGLQDDKDSSNCKIYQTALEQLYRSMSWCASRQVMLDLASGKYVSTVSPIFLPKFLKDIAAGNAGITIRDVPAKLKDEGKFDVAFDVKLALLALENAKTNAISHGCGGRAELGAVFRLDDPEEGSVVVFSVKNPIPAESQVTNEVLREAMRVAKQEASRGVSPALSGPAGGGAAAGAANLFRWSPLPLERKSSFNTRAGLPHIHLACQGAGGSFNLELDENSGEVVCSITLPAKLVPRTAHAKERPAPAGMIGATSVPAPLIAPGGLTSPLGAAPSSPRKDGALQHGLQPGCKLLAIDDSAILCKGYSRIVLPLLKADKQRSRVVCPTSRTEVDAFVDSALGHNTDGSSDPADIVLLDQNIDLGGGDKAVLGTDLADRLRSNGFKGLILIRSANASDEDRTKYFESGAVDGCISKEGSNRDVAASIQREYDLNRKRKSTTKSE